MSKDLLKSIESIFGQKAGGTKGLKGTLEKLKIYKGNPEKDWEAFAKAEAELKNDPVQGKKIQSPKEKI